MAGVDALGAASTDLHVGDVGHMGRFSGDLRQHQKFEHRACMSEQPFLGPALLTPQGEGPYKFGLKHCLSQTYLDQHAAAGEDPIQR